MYSIGFELSSSTKAAINADIETVKALVNLANSILNRWGARMEIDIVEAKK